MRILSLGFPMPGPQVVNHSFVSAPSFFDYTAIVVNPLALSQLVDDVVAGKAEYRTRGGELVVNGPAGQGMVALADLLRDRRAETERLLARGGIVVCVAHPNERLEGVAGVSNYDRYSWLPAPQDVCYDAPFLHRGNGTEIVAAEMEHPFARYVIDLRGKLAYQAYFDDSRGMDVFARSEGGAAVGMELLVGAGRVVFLPSPAREPVSEQRYAISSAIAGAVRGTLRLASASRVPGWVREYSLPGLDERRAARDERRMAVEDARRATESAEAALDEIEQYTRLLWEEGRYGLGEPVRAALTCLGLRVLAHDVDAPAEVRTDTNDPRERAVALLEVEGSVDAVGMEPHYRLRKRLEEAIASGKSRRGLLIINGHRTLPPSERPQQYTESLRIAAETMRYCVATAEQLFRGVRMSLSGEEAGVASLRQRLLSTDGIMLDD